MKHPVAAIILLLAGAYFLKLSGFCFQEARYLSDERLKLVALKAEMRKARFAEPHGGAEGYLEAHPECCKVRRWYSPLLTTEALNALFGRRFFEVAVAYPRDKPDAEGAFVRAYAIIDCCALQIVDRYSIKTDRPELI